MLFTIFIVSQVEVSDEGVKIAKGAESIIEAMAILNEENRVTDWMLESYQGEDVWVRVERAEGDKCARCWNRSVSVGTISKAPEICERCSTTIS